MLCHLQIMREGTDVTLVSFGKLVGYDLEVAEKLEKEGISVEVTCPICHTRDVTTAAVTLTALA